MIHYRSDVFRFLILAALLQTAQGGEISVYLDNVSSNDGYLSVTDILSNAKGGALATNNYESTTYLGNLTDYGDLSKGEISSNYSPQDEIAANSSLKTSYNTSIMPEWMVLEGINMANSGHLFKKERARSVEDLIGAFSICKVIKLLDSGSCTMGGAQWMPCI